MTSRSRFDHVTLRDPTLLHQVVLFMPSGSGSVHVSCNCLMYFKRSNQGGTISYHSMGATANIEESRELYNNPGNHQRPFTDKDKAKW